MIEYITKEQAWEIVKIVARHGGVDSIINADKRLANMPPADVVEVVRCEDCKHRVVDEIVLSLTSVPETAWICDIGITACLTGFYCKRGERKDGEDL